MEPFYFPESLYVEAHEDYLRKTGKDPQEVLEYSLQNIDFFVEVVFSYVDKLPYPEMKETM